MLLKSFQSLMRLGRLRRGIAIFLLAMAFFDMAIVDLFFPQLCGDDQLSILAPGPAESSEKIADEFAATRNQDPQPAQDSHQSGTDEDCFCCCSHIIPSPHVNVATLNCQPRPDDPEIIPFPSSSPHGVFHPPRLT
jgi:hypothetical protein